MEGRVRNRGPSNTEKAGKCNGVVDSTTTPDVRNVRKLIYRRKPTLESFRPTSSFREAPGHASIKPETDNTRRVLTHPKAQLMGLSPLSLGVSTPTQTGLSVLNPRK